MNLIHQSATYIEQDWTLQGIYRQIEAAARTCYKSEDMINEDSAEKMVNALIRSSHYAMLEHGTVYLEFPDEDTAVDHDWVKYFENPYSHCLFTPKNTFVVTTNYRVIVENHWKDDLKYLCAPTEWHPRRHTIRCITNLQVSHELVRHRIFSFAMESTRYCNYSKGKFGSELTFIWPTWFGDTTPKELSDLRASGIMAEYTLSPGETDFIQFVSQTEKTYFALLEQGWKPQQAAQVLPKALKTEIVITGFDCDWVRFLQIRQDEITGPVHPQMKELATKIASVLP